MVEASISELLPDVPCYLPKSDLRRQKLIECVLTGNSKQYLGNAYTLKNRLTSSMLKKWINLFNNYEAKLSGQMVKSIIRMYSIGACAVLGMSNQDVLSEVLESDPFLSSAARSLLANFTTESVRFSHL